MSTATMAEKRLPRSLSGCLEPPPPTSAEPTLDPSLLVPAQMSYRSTGLGFYAIAVRCCTMPLEKLAMIMNSAQVSGQGQMRQALAIVFKDGPATPFRTVGPASITAWFFQYSVMGFIFQLCDRSLSKALQVEPVAYGEQLMEAPAPPAAPVGVSELAKGAFKAILAPALAGAIESGVANRAECQRFYGKQKFAHVEKALGWGPAARQCGPAYLPNASRNFVMSATSFVVTPTLYRNHFPQERKSQSSLLWFGLGLNIFFGNVVAITQQSLWGRSLDFVAPAGGAVRPVNYGAVVGSGLRHEGVAAFITAPKWFARVLMNAPIQGTVPWFYNEVLPLGEGAALRFVARIMRATSTSP